MNELLVLTHALVFFAGMAFMGWNQYWGLSQQHDANMEKLDLEHRIEMLKIDFEHRIEMLKIDFEIERNSNIKEQA